MPIATGASGRGHPDAETYAAPSEGDAVDGALLKLISFKRTRVRRGIASPLLALKERITCVPTSGDTDCSGVQATGNSLAPRGMHN